MIATDRRVLDVCGEEKEEQSEELLFFQKAIQPLESV
jgi:hypothetical protein